MSEQDRYIKERGIKVKVESRDDYERRLKMNHAEMVKTKVTSQSYNKFREGIARRDKAEERAEYERRNGR